MTRFSHRTTLGKYHYNSLVRLFFIFLLVVALPVFIWAVLTQRIELRKRAATNNQGTCWNRVQQGQGGTPGNYYWPNGCKGNPTPQMCTQATVPLSATEEYKYAAWINSGKQYIAGCGMPTPKPVNNKPYCASYGATNTEGWYINGKLVRLANCGTCQARCGEIGSRSEGWYDCNNELIQWTNCANVTPTPRPTCAPRPRCLNGNEYPDCARAGVTAPLPPGGWYCPAAPTPTPSKQVICWNRVQQGQDGTPGNYYWPNGCKGNPNAQVCTQAIVNLTEKEMRQYKIWISQGSPLQPVCGMATETPKNSADLDNNGRMNITDYILFMKAWWLKDTTRGDLNHDGKISVIDYTLFMNEWNAAK